MKITNDLIIIYLDWYNSGLSKDAYAHTKHWNYKEFLAILKCAKIMLEFQAQQ